MTIVTEYRLKCDYCGNVSPVVGEVRSNYLGYIEPTNWPVGWVGLAGHYIPNDPLGRAEPPHHFCTSAHGEAWVEQREEKTA